MAASSQRPDSSASNDPASSGANRPVAMLPPSKSQMRDIHADITEARKSNQSRSLDKFSLLLLFLALCVMAGLLGRSIQLQAQQIKGLETEIASVKVRDAALQQELNRLKSTPPPTAAPATPIAEAKPALSPEDSLLLRRLDFRQELWKLSEEIISKADRQAYQSLEDQLGKVQDPELKTAIQSKLMEIDGFFASTKTLLPPPNPQAPKLQIAELVTNLRATSDPWTTRAAAARLLEEAKSLEAAQMLARAIPEEKNLFALLQITESFRRLTQCPLPDLFGSQAHVTWLKEHEAEVQARLGGEVK